MNWTVRVNLQARRYQVRRKKSTMLPRDPVHGVNRVHRVYRVYRVCRVYRACRVYVGLTLGICLGAQWGPLSPLDRKLAFEEKVNPKP